MKTKAFSCFILFSLVVLLGQSCKKDKQEDTWPQGVYNHSAMQNINGFVDQRPVLLANNGVTLTEFIALSTDSAWAMSVTDQTKLMQVRESVSFPVSTTVLQKVIPLEDVGLYMNNTYGGTVGGFVSSAGDVKSLSSLSDIYYGMRLDYPGTKFKADGGGYAILRFTSNLTDNLHIPYCPEMGGTQAHAWPNTGGGFTASSLGDGGFPEYTFNGYYAPNQGGELYEVTPAGNEILRAQYSGTKWSTVEPVSKNAIDLAASAQVKNPIRNGVYAATQGGKLYPALGFSGGKWQIQTETGTMIVQSDALVNVTSYALYKGYSLHVRGCDGLHYYLSTTDPSIRQALSLKSVDKGLYGITVPIKAVDKVWETVISL